MSEEELKAVEHYKMFEDAIKQTISKGDSELYIDGLEKALKDTEVILNLIEKQQKEIEDIKTNIRDTIRDLEEEQYVEYDGMVQDFIDTLKDLY